MKFSKMLMKTYKNNGILLKYYEIENGKTPLVLIHAQGVDGKSFEKAAKKLSKAFHIYSVDCYGHGGSLHDPNKYNIVSIGTAITDFIKNTINRKVWLLGHSSGGLIAGYIASQTDLCEKLILEDPPFFASQGERRKNTFNYVDLSTVCHSFAEQTDEKDFVLYYFANQYAWNFFPEKSRDKIRGKLIDNAKSFRMKYPHKDLKVMFWPKAALTAFQGMNNYDSLFGEAFYNDSFHSGILHEDILKNIRCKTVFMKAKTDIGAGGLLMAALDEDDIKRVAELIDDCKIVRFDCGHGIHTEKVKEFVKCLLEEKANPGERIDF